MGGLGGPDAGEPDRLAWIHPPLGGPFARLGDALAGEREHLERVALRSGRGVLFDQSVADPAVDGPAGGVGVPPKRASARSW
ncbi:MAG: hypothetical protein OXP36_13775 [Gammaproteobacteria bacterium]|nr:hypothetical protein [Gammaproteobacteria bacterium]